MPRGVYDRSKMKKNKDKAAKAQAAVAETTAVAKAPKAAPKKRGRKPNALKAAIKAAAAQAPQLAQACGPEDYTKSASYRHATAMNAISVLSQVKVPSELQDDLNSELQLHFRALTEARREIFGLPGGDPEPVTAETEEEVEDEEPATNGKTAAPVAVSPNLPPLPVATLPIPPVPSH